MINNNQVGIYIKVVFLDKNNLTRQLSCNVISQGIIPFVTDFFHVAKFFYMRGDTLFSRRCYSAVLHKKSSLRSRRNKPRLVTSPKQCGEPCSRPPMDSTIQKCASISFHPDWQIDNAFLTGQSCRALKSGYTGGGLKQGVRRFFADGLTVKMMMMMITIKLMSILHNPKNYRIYSNKCPTSN